jgi:hypothetical protein
MIDDKLLKQLKTYIAKHYQLVTESPLEEIREVSRGRFSHVAMESLAHAHMHRPLRGPSFEDITDTLAGFIRKERKSDTFSTMLDRMRQEKEMTAAQLYNGAWIKKQLYSKIMGERNYHPSKNTVIAFCLSLQLDQEEAEELLEVAGYRFSNSSIADLVILFCLDHDLYDLHDVNALLLSADQKVLCRE